MAPRDSRSVESILVQALEQLDREGPAGFERTIGEHPEHALELRRRVEWLRGLSLLPATPSQPARRFGRFEVLGLLGSGGMGIVYRALDPTLGREVAVKTLRSHLADERARRRFEREARLIAGLRHASIVPVHEFGEQDGIPYFVMAMVEGETLATRLEACRRVGRGARDLRPADLWGQGNADSPGRRSRSYVQAACELALQVVAGLRVAHAGGVVHRDIKPSNIMVAPDGTARLLDFGLAHDGATSLTHTGDVLGTPAYLAPEQVAGDNTLIDARTDVFALGVTLYEMLTLRLPFSGRSSELLLRAIAQDEPKRMRRLNPAVPRDLETICLTALEKDRARRYASIDAFGADLQRFLCGQPVEARPLPSWARAARALRRHKARSAALALALFVAVALPTGLALANLRIRQEAEATTAFAGLLEELFLDADYEELGRHAKAIDLLRSAAERVPIRLQSQPTERGRLLARIGGVLFGLGDLPTAERALDTAIATWRDEVHAPSTEWADALNQLGNLHRSLGRAKAAEQAYRQARAMAGSLGPTGAAGAAMAGENLVGLLLAMGRHGDAQSLLLVLLDERARLPADPRAMLSLRHLQADLAFAQGDVAGARAIIDELIVQADTVGTNSHLANLGLAARIARRQRDFARSLRHETERLAICEAIHGPNAMLTAEVTYLLGTDLEGSGQTTAAARLYELAHQRVRQAAPSDTPNITRAFIAYRTGALAWRKRRLEPAAAMLNLAADEFAACDGLATLDRIWCIWCRAQAETRRLGASDAAGRGFTEAIERGIAVGDAANSAVAAARTSRIDWLLARGEQREARAEIEALANAAPNRVTRLASERQSAELAWVRGEHGVALATATAVGRQLRELAQSDPRAIGVSAQVLHTELALARFVRARLLARAGSESAASAELLVLLGAPWVADVIWHRAGIDVAEACALDRLCEAAAAPHALPDAIAELLRVWSAQRTALDRPRLGSG